MEYFHLTTPQKNIWNLQKYYEDTAIGNICGAIVYKEKRNCRLLQRAVCQLLKQQSGLRLQFCEAAEPKQYVSDEQMEDIPILTFSTMEDFDRYAEETARVPIGLGVGAMYRIIVFRTEKESGILAVFSHLVSDAWTFSLMANQVDEAYQKLLEETGETIAEADYREYIQSEADYFCSNRYLKDKSYWEEKYMVRPETSQIKLYPAQPASITAKRITRVLPATLEAKINTFCQTHPVTEAVLFETALMIYLSRINQENQTLTIGVPVLNRCNAREKCIAGMFISTMPLTVTITEDMSAAQLAAQITKGHMRTF